MRTVINGCDVFAGQRDVEPAATREQDDHDADRGGDHVLRVPDADGGDDAVRVCVRPAGENARVLRKPRPSHHLQLPHGGQRRVQLHPVLRHEPQVPAHAHDHVHAVSGGAARAQRHAPVVCERLPGPVRHHGAPQHRSHADDRNRHQRRQTRTARPVLRGRLQDQQILRLHR